MLDRIAAARAADARVVATAGAGRFGLLVPVRACLALLLFLAVDLVFCASLDASIVLIVYLEKQKKEGYQIKVPRASCYFLRVHFVPFFIREVYLIVRFLYSFTHVFPDLVLR